MANDLYPDGGTQGETRGRIQSARAQSSRAYNARDGPVEPGLYRRYATEAQEGFVNGSTGELLLPFGGGGIPEPSLTSLRIHEMAERALIDLDQVQPEPERFLTLAQAGETFTLGTAGNFSLVTGKAKSRKTFFTTMLIASALAGETAEGVIRGCLPYGKEGVLLFDTEQGHHHVQMAARRAVTLAGPEAIGWLETYSLRAYSPVDRLAVIEYLLLSTPGVGLVVIDGIRDLVTSINDEEQASMLMGKLLRWSKELGIHIVVVLHQNKGDSNARGHLGTEANNKAEIVISVTLDKNKGSSSAKVECSRELGFSPFSFTVNEEGLPMIVERDESAEGKPAKRGKREIPPETMRGMLDRIFDLHPNPKYGELAKYLMEQAAGEDYPITLTKAKTLVSDLKAKGEIRVEGKEGTRYSYYVLELPF
ncbi:AAA family ATPase [Rufibacter latericius]|uniref:Mobilization protein n=1 Tax=Rufibacter latericius TaxID=2487040 RepID=A0A3M9MTJ7_9BACT|nr:AAA family ATPase [Rufibacter latericius]RNI28831.1 hypothetical protein EFB08_09395 [Rufibacter latericius]